MYHSVCDDEKDSRGYYGITTSVEMFRRQMDYLHAKGYTGLSLAEAVRQISSGKITTGNAFVLTFDDGYRDFYTHAFPVILQYGFPASVFLPASFIGRDNKGLKEKEHLDWKQVKEIAETGISFGSHTFTHPGLISMKRETIEYEVRHSKEVIEENIGKPVETFSYPFSFPEAHHAFKLMLKTCLTEAGYACGVSTRVGTANTRDDIFFLKRLPVNSDDDMHFLKAKLSGSYDWLHRFQYAAKVIKRIAFR
jgi:peptidoglycan/xylan/chitin deacetylase (PgdA/CDA1 family)